MATSLYVYPMVVNNSKLYNWFDSMEASFIILCEIWYFAKIVTHLISHFMLSHVIIWKNVCFADTVQLIKFSDLMLSDALSYSSQLLYAANSHCLASQKVVKVSAME